MQTFSGSGLPAPWGSNNSHTGIVSTSYDAEFTTVTDQAGKTRRSKVDGLGRLIRVDEPDSSGNLGTTGAPTQPTSYVYDVAGNLKTVTQGVQTRTFVYSSLSRLASATNPESGTISYLYDNNGNLTKKTDPRGYIDYSYDALNRITTRTYSDGTPTVTYTYDAPGVSYSKGRLTSMSSSASTTNYTTYDPLGRITANSQVTDGQVYSIAHRYNRAGNLVSITYPSGRIVTTEYDLAGRMAGVQHQQSGTYYAGGAATDASNRMQYAAHGGSSVMKLGNGLWEHTNFNTRLQPTEIGLGTSSTSSGTLGLTYDYGTTNNNGNVLSVSYAGGGLSYTQTFGYDTLNRLTASHEGSAWSQTNSYDRYGNRSIVGSALSFSAINNRITNAGYVYDAAGNLTNDGVHSYGFDGEDKIKSVDGVGDVFRYDGDGNRVRKNFVSGEKVRMVYSAGQLIAEYDLSNGALLKEYVYGGKGLIATVEPSAGTKYATVDHLGTLRVVTDSAGAVVTRHDYKPFGDEIEAAIGGRTTGMGFSATNSVRLKFTQKERDTEIGLDYFGARYLSSTQGRFTSADPDNYQAKLDLSDPQSWNAYSYVNNNPLRRVDPDGRGLWERLKNALNGYGFRTNEEVQQLEDKWRNYLLDKQKQYGSLIFTGQDGNPRVIDPAALSRNEVFHFARSFREAEYDGRLVTYTPEQVNEIRGNQAPVLAAPTINFSSRQLQKKFKHSGDFGVKGNYNPTNASQFQKAMEGHLSDPATKAVNGTYRGQSVTHYVNPNTGLNVMKDAAGNYLSGWKLSPAQLKHVTTTGKL